MGQVKFHYPLLKNEIQSQPRGAQQSDASVFRRDDLHSAWKEATDDQKHVRKSVTNLSRRRSFDRRHEEHDVGMPQLSQNHNLPPHADETLTFDIWNDFHGNIRAEPNGVVNPTKGALCRIETVFKTR
jgi:hypothetical protein